MRTTKKILSMILAFVLVLGMLPATVFATGSNEPEYVYISVSDDGTFVSDLNSALIAHVGIPLDALAAIDLDSYELGDYKYDKDGDGAYEITALHLYIYIHEQLLGLEWSDVTITGGAGSIYFAGNLFGFSDENLRYNYNGAYPADENGWGLTADQIVLSAGDYFDVAHYSDWSFYMDSAYGFNYFTDSAGEITHNYTVETGTALNTQVVLVGGGMGMGETKTNQANFEVFYGTEIGSELDSVWTNDDGVASITFNTPGTYYVWCCGGYGIDMASGIVSSPASAKVTVTGGSEDEPEQPREPQSVSTVLNATMAKLASTVTAPVFGTTAGEWTVFSLARGNHFAKDNAYFTDYYNRIVETVNTKAASVDMSGALHASKSTENSRLIVALSAIGKNATSVGDWDLVEAYSANGFSWIKKQGLNGTIWALIALDSNNYPTSDTTIRQQCVDDILAKQHDDGGWSTSANLTYVSDPDMTGMALTALYPYRNQPAVAAAAEEAFACLSAMQHDNGTFASGGSECSESCAWVIVAATAWGINPDTDSRFIKNGKSVVDGLLAHYLEEEAQFQHTVGAGANAMATDQSCYALVAYDRFINGKTALYDYSDVVFDEVTAETDEMTATLGVPAEVNPGSAFNGIISINKWDNEAGYKLIDFVMNVPEGVTVTDVTPGSRLAGGTVSWNLEAETGKLRVVYFDANENTTLTVTGEEFPAELFTVSFKAENVSAGSKLSIVMAGMSVKLTADSSDENAMVIVNTGNAKGTVDVVAGVSFSAVCLYQGDDVDLIPADKKAVAVAVTGVTLGSKLTFKLGETEVAFQYSQEVSAKTGVSTYVALVDSEIEMEQFVNDANYTIGAVSADGILFGDVNGDGVVNAQDALAVSDAWLRKNDAPNALQILAMNVNGDSRINTFDALGIVEAFVNGTEYGVVTKAATITTKQ